MPVGMSFQALVAEHAAALRENFDRPVDLYGVSTGGSIAQQLAAEHPHLVRRLLLVSTVTIPALAAAAIVARRLPVTRTQVLLRGRGGAATHQVEDLLRLAVAVRIGGELG